MTTTIHFIDAFDHWPVEEIACLENQPFTRHILMGEGVPEWAIGTVCRPDFLASTVNFSIERTTAEPDPTLDWHIYIINDYTGGMRQYASVGSDSQIIAAYNRNGPATIRCSECTNRWVVGQEAEDRDRSQRPIFRRCCSNFVCSYCHPQEIGLWECQACDTEHCTNIEDILCPECDSISCIQYHCGGGEQDLGYDDYDSGPQYRSRSVNTTLRLRGATHEKARGGRYIGVEIEAEDGEGVGLTDSMPYGVGVTGDGSLSNGVEIQTPPARGSALVEVIEQSTRALKEYGWDVSDRCGLHVHIDMGDKADDGVFLGRLYAAFYAIEPLLFRLQGGRRDNNSYCIPLKDAYSGGGSRMQRKSAKRIMADWHQVRKGSYESDEDFDRRLEAYMRDKYHQSRYRATNFHSIGCHGTLEIRLHEGTLDSDEILAWADLIQSVVRGCEDDRWPGGQRLRFASNPIKAQRMFRFTRKTREYLVNRLNQEATNLSGKRYAVTAGSIVEASRGFESMPHGERSF